MAEQMIEQAAKQSGQDIDVDISGNKMTIGGTDEDGETVDVSIDGESATVTPEDGNATLKTGSRANIPGDFPEDVPLYEKMNVMAVQEDSASGAVSITAQSKDSLAKVAEYYNKQAESNGWTQVSDMSQSGAVHTLAYSKGERNLNLVLMGDDGVTNIQLTVVKE